MKLGHQFGILGSCAGPVPFLHLQLKWFPELALINLCFRISAVGYHLQMNLHVQESTFPKPKSVKWALRPRSSSECQTSSKAQRFSYQNKSGFDTCWGVFGTGTTQNANGQGPFS
jgi:hypothetical protein